MLRKASYNAGVWFRNRKIFENYNFLIESQAWTVERLEAYQLEKLRDLLDHAYRNSEFHKERMEKAGLRPDRVKSLRDLELLPPTTKDELLNNLNRIQNQSLPEKHFFSETSGSTGRPLVFYRNQDWDAWHRASVFRGYSWYGVNPWDRNGYLWGFNYSLKRRLKTRFLDFLQNRFRLFSYNDEEIDVFSKKLRKAAFLSGYSSMIYEVAKRINARGGSSDQFRLKLVKGTSEKIFDKYQDEVRRAFGKKMISEYGAAEAGIIAFECPKGNMHINMETVIVEEVNKEIMVTNLVSKSFPIIRYKLGDYIRIVKNKQCPCGMKHPVVVEVVGRIGKVIYGTKEQYPSLTLYYVFKNLASDKGLILNYQAMQKNKGSLVVDLENELDPTNRELLIGEFRKYFGDDLVVEICDRVNLMSAGGKRTDFISEMDHHANWK